MEELEAIKSYCLRAVELKRELHPEDLPREVVTTLVVVHKKGKPYTRRLVKQAIKDLNLKPGCIG